MIETIRPTNGHAADANTTSHHPGMAPTNHKIADINQASHHPLEGVVTDGPAKILLQMQTGLFEHGRTRARLSGATKPIPVDQQALEEHALAMARQTYQESFDPEKNHHDKARQDDYQHHLDERVLVEQGVAHARANLRDAENRVAKTPKAGDKPLSNHWLLALAIATIAITIAPTLHDRFFTTIGDDLLAWFGSLAGAGAVAGFLASAIVIGRRSLAHWIGLYAGIGIGIALAVIRLSGAETIGEATFAIGLTIFEIAAVLLLEFVARGLREAEDTWARTKEVEDQEIRLRDTAQTELIRWTKRLEEIGQAIRDYVAYMEERATRNMQVSEVEAAAVKAALDGYNAGINENLGRILGVRGGLQ